MFQCFSMEFLFILSSKYALGVYFKSVNNAELSKRLDFDKLSEIFGDRLSPLQTNVKNDYSMCFV